MSLLPGPLPASAFGIGEVRCCKCGKFIRSAPELKAGQVSHGYCPVCLAEAKAEVEKFIDQKGNKR